MSGIRNNPSGDPIVLINQSDQRGTLVDLMANLALVVSGMIVVDKSHAPDRSRASKMSFLSASFVAFITTWSVEPAYSKRLVEL